MQADDAFYALTIPDFGAYVLKQRRDGAWGDHAELVVRSTTPM
jgi:hypothetical protein